jgi:hypothetical protein
MEQMLKAKMLSMKREAAAAMGYLPETPPSQL